MCEICKNSVARNYPHCRNKHHYRLLLEIMQYKKNDKFKCYKKPNCLISEKAEIPQQQP